MQKKIKREIKAIVAEVTRRPLEEIADDASFLECLDVNSMLLLEILAQIERIYGIRIPEREMRNLTSVDNAAKVVAKFIEES